MASGPSSSAAPFYGIREEDIPSHLKSHALHQHHHQQQLLSVGGGGGGQQAASQAAAAAAAPASAPAAQPAKKKRNTPGAPYPDAEVIALSPKTLMATNRFLCEVCGKGFQREQNLQLHRRGHNLPWKLKQKNPKDAARRRVYLCPEPTCVHHDPSRALGDLTGIKKHFCRKHGEKKWKCDKCSKRYAVQSDWKAHAKTCGTREYRCDCGTLFSRRDSFITHRAFCDALAQESARIPSGLGAMGLGSHLFGPPGGNPMTLSLAQLNSQLSSQLQSPATDILRLGANGHAGHGAAASQFDHIINGGAGSVNQSSFRPPPPQMPGGFFLGGHNNTAANSHNNNNNNDNSMVQNHHFNVDQAGQQHNASSLLQKSFQSGGGGGLINLSDLQTNPNAAQNAAANGGGNGMFNLGFFSNSSSTSSVTNSNGNNGGGGGAGSNNNASGSSASQSYQHHFQLQDQFNNNTGRVPDNNHSSVPMFPPIGLMGGSTDHVSVGQVPSSSMFDAPILPQMSATALLQKAAQMGATSSGMMSNGAGVSSAQLIRPFGGLPASRTTMNATGFRTQMDNDAATHFQDLLMSSLAGGITGGLFDGGGGGGGTTGTGGGVGPTSMFGSSCNGNGNGTGGDQDHASGFGGYGAGLSMFDVDSNTNNNSNANNHATNPTPTSSNTNSKLHGSDGMTRDFLGVGGVGARPRTGGGGGMPGAHHQRENPQHHQYGLGIGPLDSSTDMKSAAGTNNNAPFGSAAAAGGLH